RAQTDTPSQTQPHAQPKPVEVGGIPLTPARTTQPAETPSAVAPPPPPKPAPVPVVAAPPPPPVAPVPERTAPLASMNLPQQPPMPSSSAQVRASAGAAGFSPAHAAHDIQPPKKRGMSLEETVGTNWLPKIGITAVVIGVGFLLAHAWGGFSAWLRVLILYAS